jgi:cholesterol oxidase
VAHVAFALSWPNMPTLSLALSDLRPFYDVLVIGSGYGGAIAASTLARARRADGSRLSVALLERGREFPVGSFPTTMGEASGEFQLNAAGEQHGKQDALYWFHAGSEAAIFHGCGLGGTSLINAGVALRPEPRVFDDPRWPREFTRDREGLERGFERAIAMLRPAVYPGTPALAKDRALLKTAERLGAQDATYAPPLSVTFDALPEGRNHVGVPQTPCNGCGECVAGCNVGAKNTLAMNYLPDARNHGAEIFCRVRVTRLESTLRGYRVHYQPVHHERDAFLGDELFVTAGAVILAAGVVGSSEILLRSKYAGLACSDRIGEQISGNGDLLGFAVGAPGAADGFGLNRRAADPGSPPGPCITLVVDRRARLPLAAAHVLQNGVIPGPLASFIPAVIGAITKTATGGVSKPWERIRAAIAGAAAESLARSPSVDNTQTLLVMSHDERPGTLSLEGEHAHLTWLRSDCNASQIHRELAGASTAAGARYVAVSPTERPFPYQVTVHPLGGCAMSDDARTGVTNHKGQVFSGNHGSEVHRSLYVIDGSVVPCSLGVNPHLTIAAIAERNVRLFVRDHDLVIGAPHTDDEASSEGRPDRPDALHVQFTEKITGYCSMYALDDDDHERSAKSGEREQNPCELVVTVASDDVRRMAVDPEHSARITGSVTVPALSRSSMTISEGRFNLFRDTSDARAQKHMCYRLTFESAEGRTFHLDGFKRLGGRHAARIWRDTTTLYVTIHEGTNPSGKKVAQGILYITASAFTTELLKLKATDSRGRASLSAMANYGWLFASGLWEMYNLLPRRKRGRSS